MIRKSTLNDPPAKRAKKPRQKSPKAEKPLKEVKAEFGKWSYVSDPAGKLMFCEGRFPEDRLKEAGAAARNLEKEIITCNAKGEKEYRTPVWKGHEWVIHLDRHTDNMDKFDEWMLKRNLLPGRKEELQDIARESHWQERVSAARNAQPYKPTAQSLVTWFINNALDWSVAEAGDDKPQLVTSTPYPAVAYQVAFYLHKQRYMDDKDFRRIFNEIKNLGVKKDILPDEREFHFSIPQEHTDRFIKQFPKSGEMKQLSSAQWEKEITRLPSRHDNIQMLET